MLLASGFDICLTNKMPSLAMGKAAAATIFKWCSKKININVNFQLPINQWPVL
jgi:hypothetical protein